jgi:hypothetical protein
MKKLDEFFQELTDEQIEQAYHENEEWRKSGVLQDGVLRNLYSDFTDQNYSNSFPIHLISEPLLYELIKRYRKLLNK